MRVSVTELALLASAVVVGTVALVSLAAAHLHHHSLPLVAGISAVLLVGIAVLVVRFDRVTVVLDPAGLVPAAIGLALAAVMFFPGFEYGTGDRDPGAYVEHAVAIARTHSIDFPDESLATGLPGGQLPGTRWPALWVEPGKPTMIFPQFYHLWPALLATAKDAGGFTGLFNVAPLMGVLAVGLAVAMARRIAGLPGAWTAAALLSTNMLQVWQAKYPSSEIFGQMLFVAALLGMVLAIRARWRTAAAASGALISLSYLERADGILLVLLAWGVLCTLYAARRFDARAGWFTGAMLALLPYGLFQAYKLAERYTLTNKVPSLKVVLAAMVGLAFVAVVLSRLPWPIPRLIAWGSRRRSQLYLGTAFFLVCGALLLLGGLRPHFGADYDSSSGVRQRTFDEISLIRLSWFFSLPGLGLMMVGFAFVAWRRWTFDRWVIALATSSLMALYCYHVRNSPYLMWSTRRFVTSVVPGMVLVMGCGAALLLSVLRRFLPRLISVGLVGVLLAGLTTFYVSESAPLRHHNENSGSVEVVEAIGALAGNQRGVFVWQDGPCCSAPTWLFGGPLLAMTGQTSVWLPADPAASASAVARFAAYYKASGRPLFYVSKGVAPPPAIPGVSASPALELQGALPHWEETYTSRPKKTQDYTYDFRVYRLTPA